ncbi:MAG: hypothetical protein JRI77_07990 [Deltaproteobacteria bacterium]|nr:hypothetical protein [Deltaproteobacteria bacterium]
MEYWLQFSLTFLAILVALFGKELVSWLKKPRLILTFDINNESYFHDINFHLFTHEGHSYYAKGANCLLMISNPKRKWGLLQTETARGVEVKVTYIWKGTTKHTYHPTNLNWSGGKGKKSTYIIAGAHHFLDFLRFYNYESALWIGDPNSPNGLRVSAIAPNEAPSPLPKNRTYFEPWFIGDFGGIKCRFDTDGTYEIHFVVNGENCGPYSYIAKINWSRSTWNRPEIRID